MGRRVKRETGDDDLLDRVNRHIGANEPYLEFDLNTPDGRAAYKEWRRKRLQKGGRVCRSR